MQKPIFLLISLLLLSVVACAGSPFAITDSESSSPSAGTPVVTFVSIPAETSEPPQDEPPGRMPPGTDYERYDHQIDHVEATVLESDPPQLALEITGMQVEGCLGQTQVDQTQDGTTITVEIYQLIPANVMCPFRLVDYENTIRVGTLSDTDAVYTIHVNDYTLTVEP